MKKIQMLVFGGLVFCAPIFGHGTEHGGQNIQISKKNMPIIQQAWRIGESHSWCAYYRLKINGKIFKGMRPWYVRWNMIKRATRFADKKVLDLGCSSGINAIFVKKYAHAAQVTGVDIREENIQRAMLLAQAFEAPINFKILNLDSDDYENLLGYDYDVVFCMSLYRWVSQKERLLKYLSNFKTIIYEGHDSDAVERARFAAIGFAKYKVLGKSDFRRTLFVFSK